MANKLTYNELLQLRQEKLHSKIPYLDIIDMDDGRHCKVTVRCRKCNDSATRRFDYLLEKSKCPCCETFNTADKERYTLTKIRPDVAELLKNPSKGSLYSPASMEHEDFICPVCHSEINTSIRQVCRKGLYCPRCAKTNSYPNRFMFAILQSLKIDFEREYSPEFIKPMRYDFYFIVNEQPVIIEMDGGFHKTDNKMRELTYEDIVAIDKYKTDMAVKHGIDVIRIDCAYKRIDYRFEFIKDNILSSNLSQYVDLNTIDFDECNKVALIPEIKQVCEMWDNGTHDMEELRKIFKITQITLLKYLKSGQDAGICTYNHAEYVKMVGMKNRQAGSGSRRMPILCLETNEIFSSRRQAHKKYGGVFDKYFNGSSSYCGTDPATNQHLHWKQLSRDEEESLRCDSNYVFIS